MTVPVYQNFMSGTISDNPLAIGALTVNSAGFASLVAIANPNTMWMVLDPLAVNGAPEVVSITAHSASATSVTVARNQQGSSARQHPQNTKWVAGHATKSDLDTGLAHKILTTKGSLIGASAANTPVEVTVGADGQSLSPATGATPGIKWDWLGLPRFSTLSAVTAAITSPVEGMAAVVTGEDRIYMYDGSGWVRINYYSTAGRTGFQVRLVSAQSINNGTASLITWDTEDFDSDAGFTAPGTAYTIPTGLGGLWAFSCSMTANGALGAGLSVVNLVSGVHAISGVSNSINTLTMGVSAVLPLAAAASLTVTVGNGSGATRTFTGNLNGFLIGR